MACYSGGLIDDLKDENTLIITSASKDKTSFGCGHDGAFTEFGSVFFQDRLSKSRDIVSSFGYAKLDVARLEKIMKRNSSDPQIFIGKKIHPFLRKIGLD